MKQFLDYADILIAAPCYMGYLCMADKFCKKNLDASKKNELLFVILSFVGWLMSNIASRWFLVPYIFFVMVEHMLFMGLVLLLFRESWEKKILVVSVLITVMTLVSTFFTSFLSCLVLFFQHTMKMVSEPFLSEWETGVIGDASYCFVIFAVYQISGYMEPVFCGKRKKWYVILALPLIMIITMFDMVNWGASHGIMVRSGGSTGMYYDQIFSYAEFLVLTLLSMFAAGFYVFGMNRIYFEQEKSSQYHSQVAVYKMLTEQYRQSERLRHDMKNHVIALSALLRNKEWEKMGDYLKNMEGSGLEDGGDMTGNKAVDALLYQKRKLANEKNIKWECDVQMPKGHSINEFDLCVLFGNILDNALESCGRMRCGENCLINIQAKTVKKCFLIEVKNSVDMAEKNTAGVTNKENSREHGIGLLNVGDVVHEYHGALNIESENGIFITSVLIPFPDAAHDIKTVV